MVLSNAKNYRMEPDVPLVIPEVNGGHLGLLDVIEALGRSDFPRLRFGVGRPEIALDTKEWVLAPFSPDEEARLETRLEAAAEAIETALHLGVRAAMDRFNADPGA